MVEDKVCQNFILQQNLESNISLHRGSKSAELYDNSSTLLTSHLNSDVNKVILCCGTNDIANLPFTSHTVTESTQHVQIIVMNCGMIDSHCGKYKHVKDFTTTVCIKEFTIRVTIHISDVCHWGWEL